MPTRMLEKNIQDDGIWIMESDLGLADIAIWRLLGWLSTGNIAGIPIDIIKDFPKTSRVCKAVDSHPKIQDWIDSTYPTNYNRGNYI